MLTREENELLTRVGPGTPMGALLREYWMPALRSAALEADGAPVRVRLMGENFVAFRATDGRVGFFDEGCPHRCTSLALARNEDNALTCIFHGWKIDVSGKVVEVPSEPPERRAEFAAKVRVRHYPVREAGGMVWVYLGRRSSAPRFYNFEFNHLPQPQVYVQRAVMHCNWFQGLEAVLDSAHLGILHKGFISAYRANSIEDLAYANADTGPVFEMLERPYGFREGALRALPDGCNYARIREVVLPFYSFIPNNPNSPCSLICAIPIDDEWTAQWYVRYDPKAPLTQAYLDSRIKGTSGDPDNFCSDMGNIANLWHQDRRAMKEGHWTGIMHVVPYEDFVVEESMGPIVDRTREYLGQSDTVIIRTRRVMMEAARAYARAGVIPWQNAEIDYSAVRALAIRYPKEQDWTELDSFNPPQPVQTA
ncbi:MAG TPA: Rieske 2Fe-2S domain-containing protein [Candidatus Binataceae bacterium]|nr:Rieske 2Fe-2S domain-containing protein [Candidatus Binataceae bacterium]